MIGAGFLQIREVLRQVLRQPIEPILHPSVWRVRWLGIFIVFGHFAYGLLWSYGYPQIFENLWIRLCFSIAGFVLIANFVTKNTNSLLGQHIFVIASWIQLPLFFNSMYFLNQGSSVWLASCVAMVLIYYNLTDWRIATIGTILGLLIAGILFLDKDESPASLHSMHFCVYLFAWFSALLLSVSSVNLRAQQLKYTRTTMGVLAHELRTPIASVSLLSSTLRSLVESVSPEKNENHVEDRLKFVSTRLDALVRVMTNHIDTQIANAQQITPITHFDRLDTLDCVQEVLNCYPFNTDADRDCVVVDTIQNFEFLGVKEWLIQVLNNIIKNALYALASKQTLIIKGDLRLTIKTSDTRGLIVLADRGIGIKNAIQKNIFQPFYSTKRAASHGLGLAYCQRVVAAFGGRIDLWSEEGVGTTLTLNFPLASPSTS